MRITNVSILCSEVDLIEILKQFLLNRNVFIKEIKINDGIQIRNISYKILKNINIALNITKVIDNKIYIKISKLNVNGICIPKYVLDFLIRFVPTDIVEENKNDKHGFVINLNNLMRESNFGFKLRNISLKEGFAQVIVDNINVKFKQKKFVSKNKGGLRLKLTQTTLRLSGEDIMSFVRDFVKNGNFMISGIDISQAIYLKGIIISSFEVGDVSLNIKDLKENLIYVQVKIINCLFPGVNIEHIPIKIFVKDLLSVFGDLNLDLDVNGVRFIDDCIEVRINNFNLDMKKLSSGRNNVFLK